VPVPDPAPTGGRCFPEYYGSIGVDLDDGTATSGSGGKGTGNTSGTPQTPEAAPTDADADSSESAACQLGHTPAQHSGLTIVALLGAALGLTRRRVQTRG
jgi:hypothetical protein